MIKALAASLFVAYVLKHAIRRIREAQRQAHTNTPQAPAEPAQTA